MEINFIFIIIIIVAVISVNSLQKQQTPLNVSSFSNEMILNFSKLWAYTKDVSGYALLRAKTF